MPYYWFKAFHIIGVVVWFAGLFYLVRLFIYHVEAEAEPEPAATILKNQYTLMEKRLYRIITTPGMIVTVAMAVGLLWTNPEWLKQGWMHAKLGLVVDRVTDVFGAGNVVTFTASGAPSIRISPP